ncbi:MAG: hypothetical protein M1830_010051 [Pleopsidium flavum]|nr:MAG: hypothetical protein M1830_010051 [Pleopsidium flavum]
MASASTTPAPPQTSTFTSTSTSTSTSRSSAANANATANAPLPPSSSKPGTPTLTPLEQEILNEYTRLLSNLNLLSTSLSALSNTPTAEILDSLRLLERKTSLVFTLLKASVYSIVLQQQIREGGGG